jgi:hypothetical protein
MTSMLTPALAQAALADVQRDVVRRGRIRSALRRTRRRRAARSVALVPAPVRVQRPAGW